MGGAQPLAATMTGACFLGVDVDPSRIEKRMASGYCDEIAWSLDDALAALDAAQAARAGAFRRARRQRRRCACASWSSAASCRTC